MRSKVALIVFALLLATGQAGVLDGQPAPAQAATEMFSPDLFSSLEYRMVGPSRGGRVTAVAGYAQAPARFTPADIRGQPGRRG